MPKVKRTAKKRKKVSHLHKIIFCVVLFSLFVTFFLSPWSDFNPDWIEPNVQKSMGGQEMGVAIKVRGDVDELEGIKGVLERLMILTTADGKNPNTPERYVNGMKNPTMHLRPGQTVRLEIINASADDMFRLAIPGYLLHIISRDGNTLDQVASVDSELLAPGQRVQILFTPNNYGTIPVKSLSLDQGFAKYVETTFMNIKVKGFPMFATPLPKKLIPYKNLRNAKGQ